MHVQQQVLLLSYYNNIYSSLIFVPLIFASGEYERLKAYPHIAELWFYAVMVFGGLCGFAIGFVTTLQIKVTSPLTHNISGTGKACAQTLIATFWYDQAKSTLWWTSNLIVIGGTSLYARVKQLELAEKFHSNAESQRKASV